MVSLRETSYDVILTKVKFSYLTSRVWFVKKDSNQREIN